MPIDENEHTKDVYAHFGLAVYFSQALEHGLVNALVFADLIPSRGPAVKSREQWEKAFDSFMDGHFRTTLGRMIRSLQLVVTVPADLESVLRVALEKRNWLAHHYFRERAEDFMTENRRNKMIAELDEARDLFEKADKRLGEVMKPLRVKYGFTDKRSMNYFRTKLRCCVACIGDSGTKVIHYRSKAPYRQRTRFEVAGVVEWGQL